MAIHLPKDVIYQKQQSRGVLRKSVLKICSKFTGEHPCAERGDMPTMLRLLSDQEPLNVNCTDMLGRSALLIAVDNENAEIVEMLLKYEAVITGESTAGAEA